MNKKLKKICAMALTFAITATSVISMSLSADCLAPIAPVNKGFSGCTVLDDKGMLNSDNSIEGYKILYKNGCLYRADTLFNYAKFILSEDVDYEDVNERIIEIFKEFYPENNLGVPEPSSADYDEYADNYKPNLWSKTVDGITTYTICANPRSTRSLNDEKVAAARKHSKAFMEKLDEEKLISAFYDFGEVYFVIKSGRWIFYSANADIDLINNYIMENNIDCTIEKDDDSSLYILKSNDNDRLKEFLIGADIYEATSIAPMFDSMDIPETYLYGKNALEEISDVTTSKDVKFTGDANGDEKITIKDCMFIAKKLANREGADLPDSADYNLDGKKNIKDAAVLAIDIANRKI